MCAIAPQDLLALRGLLESITPLPDEEWRWLESELRPRQFAKDAILVPAGAHDDSIHFVSAGLARCFFLTADGLERNHTFAPCGSLVGCFPVLVGASACPFAVAALQATRTVQISGPAVRAFPSRHPCWNRLWLRLVEHVALRKAAREQGFLLEPVEQRYRRFLADHADFVDRIPQYHIASWLGITPVALSRIKRRMNLG